LIKGKKKEKKKLNNAQILKELIMINSENYQ